MSENRFEELAAKSMGLDLAKEEVQQDSNETKEVSEENVETKNETQEESSLKENSTQEKSEDLKESNKSFDELLAEKTEGKYKTYDDIKDALSSKESSSDFANEQMEKLNDYVSKGGDIAEYLRTQTADYDEMDELNIVKSHMKFKNQDLEGNDIDLLFDSEYKLDEDKYTEDEIRLSKIKLKRDAKAFKRELKTNQTKSSTPSSYRQQEADKAKLEENARLWNDKIDKSLNDFKSISFDINDKGEKFDFSLSEEDVNKVKSSNKNLAGFWNRYINEDGSENISRLNKDMASLENLDSIVRSAFAQGLSKGKGDIIDDIKNPSYKPESKSGSNENLSIQQQIDAELRKNLL